MTRLKIEIVGIRFLPTEKTDEGKVKTFPQVFLLSSIIPFLIANLLMFYFLFCNKILKNR
jgi:hypothetical protein